MAFFDELPGPKTGGPDGGSPLGNAGSREMPSDVLTPGQSEYVDVATLRQRLDEARSRTKELIAVYLAVRASHHAVMARHRENSAAREETRAMLSASVARYTKLLHALGEPPERALVLIKTAFNEAAPHQDDDNRAALADIVKWVVDAYYAA